MKTVRLWWAACAAAALAACSSTTDTYEWPEWSYAGGSGPEHWGDLTPDWVLAKAGERQSPIDIRAASVVEAALDPLLVAYEPMPLEVVEVDGTIALLSPGGSRITLGSQRYELDRIRLRVPSEHTVEGEPFPMEVQLAHRLASGRVLTVAVFVAEGRANPVLAALLEHLPAERGGRVVAGDVRVRAADLLPADRGTWRYSGSLTFPPCTEDVGWLVLRKPIEASAEQIAAFRERIGGNVRPTQPLRGRQVSSTP